MRLSTCPPLEGAKGVDPCYKPITLFQTKGVDTYK